MISVWAFIFGSILCLMFLGMLYGEKLSLLGVLEGRWIEPIPRVLGHLWNQLCQALDLMVVFVADHLAWVVATVSGGIGLFIVAFLMFSGLADDAAATHRDLQLPLLAGSVIDRVPKIVVQEPALPAGTESTDDDESEMVWQQPGGAYVVFNRPELDRPQPTRPRRSDVFDLPTDDLPATVRSLDRPVLGLTFRRGNFRSMQFEDDATSITRGELIVDEALPRLIERAVRGLPRDDWRITFSDPVGGTLRPRSNRWPATPEETLPESSAAAVLALESRVRIIPGDSVAANELRIEKSAPAESGGSEVTVEINVLNVGINTVSGLLVREFLPRGTRVRRAEPQAAFRDDTLTWLLEELKPFDEQVLRFTVVAAASPGPASRRSRFESATEVSAAAAVASPTVVRNERPLRTPATLPTPVSPASPVPRPRLEPRNNSRPAELPLPAVTQRPDVRLRIMEPLTAVPVGQTVEVNFIVENRGTLAAEGVGLRVTLDDGLSHHTLIGTERRREVINGVRRLEPGDTRTIVLRMRPTVAGSLVSTAEMIFEGQQLTYDTFRVVAERRTTPPAEFSVQ